MKNTWLYKKLERLHTENSIISNDFKSGFFTNIINIIIVPLVGITIINLGLLSILLLPLYLVKDLYDLYFYINKEKIAKKEDIKKALKLKNDIESWIDSYQIILNIPKPYMLEKITYEKKLEVKPLSGVNVGCQDGIRVGELWFTDPPYYIRNNNKYQRYKNVLDNTNIIKEKLSKEFINSRHSTFHDFIFQFFIQYNNECNTIHSDNLKMICDTNRRRSLHDIYLITKYYYPEVTFIDIIKRILSLLKIGVIRGSYCSTVNKYVFYTQDISSHNSFEHTLEFTNELTFINLKEYIENEYTTK
jgi:hypothetical protein